MWPLDRDLVFDILSNALQNASRFARSRIDLSAPIEDAFLCICVEDDVPVFDAPDIDAVSQIGLGLFVARELAL